jgi:capsular polysaccharide biosynthesis protein
LVPCQWLEAKSGNNPDSSLIPTGEIPPIVVDYIKKSREVKYQETLFELMVKQFEMANMDEARKSTAIQVIDKALPPDKPVKSKRILMIALAAIIGFFLGVYLAFLRDYVGRISNDPKNRETIEELRKHSFSKKKQS